MAHKFDKGDIVVLKSGGPPMTIDHVPGEKRTTFSDPLEGYWCRWFKGATPDSGLFAEHLLDTYTPPAKK